jgi:hypothetical protein
VQSEALLATARMVPVATEELRAPFTEELTEATLYSNYYLIGVDHLVAVSTVPGMFLAPCEESIALPAILWLNPSESTALILFVIPDIFRTG